MAREKRTKPCSNCKRSKVKCEYIDTLPCTRCVKSGLASTCQIIPKLPSLVLPQVSPHSLAEMHAVPSLPSLSHHSKVYQAPQPAVMTGPAIYHQPLSRQTVSRPLQSQHPQHPTTQSQQPPMPTLSPHFGVSSQEDSESRWKYNMENKLNSFESKFDNLVEALRGNQRYPRAEIEYKSRSQLPNNGFTVAEQPVIGSAVSTPESSDSERSNVKKRNPLPEFQRLNKRRRIGNEDFRDSIISFDEAEALFKFFDSNISQQLFGFEIRKFQVSQIWESSPLLLCAVCTIAAIHYPDPSISSKQSFLQQHLHKLCSDILFQPKPKSAVEGFNIIVALVLCSFWLSDSQRFTGLALQLAKEFGLNKPVSKLDDSLNSKDRLKLWYLLYVLDGQQSMSLNREPLFDSGDYSIKNSRQLLLDKRPLQLCAKEDNSASADTATALSGKADDKQLTNEETSISHLTDLRLVSQVEYNSAIREAFKGNAWDLIAPSSFGIPSKSNLELDKWMVSWTVLLAPVNNGAVWSSKSTLIYYNFAKMHINCSALRELQVETGTESVIFPKWEKYHELSKHAETRSGPANVPEQDSDSEESDSEELITNTELMTRDQTLLNLNIAVNAAQTVLNLVLSDRDIINNLRYVPLHIHIMLYYAALLLVNPPPTDGSKIQEDKPDTYFLKIFESLRIAKALQKKIYANLPTDKSFGSKFISSLDEVVVDRTRRLKAELSESNLPEKQKESFQDQLSKLRFSNDNIEYIPESSGSSRESSPRASGIAAWPGSHHGHP